MRFCQYCGGRIVGDGIYCVHCGHKISERGMTVDDTYEKNKCRFLREVRKTIARMNNISMEFSECTHTESCRGSCPACDHEIMELEAALREKMEKGEQVFLPDVTVDHQEIIPSNLRTRDPIQDHERDIIRGRLEGPKNDIPLGGVPLPPDFEKDSKKEQKKKFPWKR